MSAEPVTAHTTTRASAAIPAAAPPMSHQFGPGSFAGGTVGRVGLTTAGSTPSSVRVESSEISLEPSASMASNAIWTSSRPENRSTATHVPFPWSTSATGGNSPANATTRASTADRPPSTSTETSIVIPELTSSARASACPNGAPSTTDSRIAKTTVIAEIVPGCAPGVMTPRSRIVPPLNSIVQTGGLRVVAPLCRLTRLPATRPSLTCDEP